MADAKQPQSAVYRHVIKFLIMKHLYILSTLLLLFTTSKLGAQVSGFAINGLTTPTTLNTTICSLTANISFSALTQSTSTAGNATIPYVITGNNFNGFQFQTVVNWGDASSSTSGGGTSTSGTNISMNPPLTHTYATPGTYMVATTVYNPANQTYAIDSVSLTVGSCSAFFYCMLQVDCNNDGTIDSQINTPVPITLSNGSTTYYDTLQSNLITVNNIWLGNYTLSIDPTWLAANNYVIGNIIPSPIVNVSGGVTTSVITLNCSAQSTLLCATGQVYCDANDNGVLDAGETPISNAPIYINGTVSYTNANGLYYITYPGIVNDSAVLTMSSNWLTQNGYLILNNNGSNVNYITGTPCNSGLPITTINFPLSCNGIVTPTLCYSGYVFCDANSNGVFDANETPLNGVPVMLYNNSASASSVTVYTDSSGYFSYCGQYSTNSNLIATISQSWLIYNGYNSTIGAISLAGSPNGTTNIGFLAINCGGATTCSDVWTTVTPWIGYYQNSTAYIKLNWGSYGPSAIGTYSLSLSFPAGVTPILSSIQNSNYIIGANTITWNLTNNASNFSNYDVIMFNIPGGLINGAQHYFTSVITPTGAMSDCGTYNNNGSLLQILGNSYDPNDKNASTDYNNDAYPLGYLDAFIDDALSYTIRFQNTGTAPAQNIYIIDTLDAHLDWNSFTLIESSHNMQVINLGNGIFRFEFPQIWLPDSTSNEPESHGHLTYRITENANNPVMSTIENTAYIYFDWNAPIITNTTSHTNMWIDGIEELNNKLRVSPNPAHSTLYIELANAQNVKIIDLSGQILIEKQIFPGEAIDILALKPGLYIIEAQGLRTKFIKN